MERRTDVLIDLAVGLAAGALATGATNLVQDALYRATPRRVQRQEERVRPAPSSHMAAEAMAEGLGYRLDEEARERAGVAVHYGLGAIWGTLYGLLRRQGLGPVGAGLLTGASLSLVVDEGVAPALGFSAPNRDYPLLTHVRGFANHLAYGAAVALVAETAYRLTGTAPERG